MSEIIVPDNSIKTPDKRIITFDNTPDNVTSYEFPDPELCHQYHEFRAKNEWLRKHTGLYGAKPSELGIEAYRYGDILPKQFYEGRNPPPVPIDSLENIEWYEEQLKRCIYGFECCGMRITGDHYWMLNFTPFMVATKDKYGNATNVFEIQFPYFSYMHDYAFKLIEEAMYEGKYFMWMSGRGSGKEQPNSEPIITLHGTKTMGEIRPGDMIMGSDGNPTKVMVVYPQGEKDVYKITLANGISTRAGAEHLWTVRYDNWNINTVNTLELIRLLKTQKMYIPVIYSKNWVPIKSIEKLPYKEESTCLTVSAPDSLYMTNGGILTHNTYSVLSIAAKIYTLKPQSHSIISASSSHHVNEAFDKFLTMMDSIAEVHPTLALNRIVDTKSLIMSGQEVIRDGVKYREGPKSKVQKVIYGDNPGATRGSRPDFQQLEECLAPGTLVLMYDKSMKPIEDIKVGDEVMGVDGSPKKVMRTTRGVDDNMYKVDQSHGISYIVNSLHKLVVMKQGDGSSIERVTPEEFLAAQKSGATMYGIKVDKLGMLSKAPPQNPETSQFETTSLTITNIGRGEYYGITLGGDKPEDHWLILDDGTITHNCGDWAQGKGNLKACLSATFGAWRVGSIRKVRAFLTGTGGSITSDQAQDIFKNAKAYNILTVNDFKAKVAFFLPAHYLYGGYWERTGVNDNDAAKADLERERERTKDDMELHTSQVQEYPFKIEEMFARMGSNIFNQKKISLQWTALQYEKKHLLPRRGFLEWIRGKGNVIKGVRFVENPEGDIEIVEPPYRGEDGKSMVRRLYVMGIDSIDQGKLDSTSLRDRSSMACLVKKRIVDKHYFSQTSNIYVAKYVGRSLDVRWDYENALKLAIYYNIEDINVEYTKIGIYTYFKQQGQSHRMMRRPQVALPKDQTDIERIAKLYGAERTTLLGTPATQAVISHQDGKIKEYIDDYYDLIYFPDLLEQLRDYRSNDRRKFDLVVAMGLAELADEELMGVVAHEEDEEDTMELLGYYTDPVTGYKVYGKLPDQQNEAIGSYIQEEQGAPDWIDMGGNLRFDDKLGVTNILDER